LSKVFLSDLAYRIAKVRYFGRRQFTGYHSFVVETLKLILLFSRILRLFQSPKPN